MTIEISNLTKKYNAYTALDTLSLTVIDSEFLAILGPSGCGKTTLLKLLGGFLEPTAGSITANGILYSSPTFTLPTEKRNIGMVFQSFALWPHMTVEEHVRFPLNSKRHQHISKQEKEVAVQEVLEAMNITDFAKRLPEQLSGGQKQRVSLARAIVAKPALLLMDEPLSALDAELRIEMRKEIQRIHRLTKATIIYVTHDQSEALGMADRIMIMNHGKIEQLDTPDTIYSHPTTAFAATFVSRSNLLKGRWLEDYFYPEGEDYFYHICNIPDYFRNNGLCPIKPEDLVISRQKNGISGTIVNKSYTGREFHYTISHGKQFLTVYAGIQSNYPIGDHIYLSTHGAVNEKIV